MFDFEVLLVEQLVGFSAADFAGAEVNELQKEVLFEDEVLGLQIPVNYAVVAQHLQRFEKLSGEKLYSKKIEFSIFLNQSPQIPVLGFGEDEVELKSILERTEQVDDAGVSDLAEDELLDEDVVFLFLLGDLFLVYDFQGEFFLRDLVSHRKDFAKGAFSYLFEDLEILEFFSPNFLLSL